MQLSTVQIEEILELLNSDDAVGAFLALETEHAGARAAWIEEETQPFYTPGNEWLHVHIEWFERLLDSRRRNFNYDGSLVHFIEPTDFYFFSGENGRGGSSYWLSQQELPLAAFLVWQTVFSFSYAKREWTARPFLGADRKEGGMDPLLQLPYSRKYDRERAQGMLRQQEWLWERLCRAKDLVRTLENRVNRVKIGRYPEAKWAWPETEDVQKQLEEDDLCFDLCGLMLYGGTIEVEILQLETVYHYHDDPPQPPSRRAGRAYARGRYQGPLSEPYPSAASYKMMIATALDNLGEALWNLLYPYSDEEYEQLQDEIETVRASLEPVEDAAGGENSLTVEV